MPSKKNFQATSQTATDRPEQTSSPTAKPTFVSQTKSSLTKIRLFAVSRPFAATLAALVAVVAVGIVIALGLSSTPSTNSASELEASRRQLRSEVDTVSGAPRSGRDPSSQPQNDLASAASKPSGTGRQLETKPATGSPSTAPNATTPASTNVQHGQHAASETLHDPKQTGTSSGGCLLAYGKSGEQCLPARAPGNLPLTCDYIRKQFPLGIQVNGTDTLSLDMNQDKVACNAGD